jgi:hypothetical protein
VLNSAQVNSCRMLFHGASRGGMSSVLSEGPGEPPSCSPARGQVCLMITVRCGPVTGRSGERHAEPDPRVLNPEGT